MQKFLNTVLLFAAILCCAMATSFAVVTFAHASTVTWSEEQVDSGFFTTGNLSVTVAMDTNSTEWIEFLSPTKRCSIGRFAGNGQWDNGAYSFGYTGWSGSFAYLATSGSTECDPSTFAASSADMDEDGIWTVNLYADQAGTTLTASDTVCVGTDCTPPEPSDPRFDATSTPDQTQQNVFNSFLLFCLGLGFALFNHSDRKLKI